MILCRRTVAKLVTSCDPWRSKYASSVYSKAISFATYEEEEEVGVAGQLVDKKILRNLIKDFSASITVKNVAREHLLKGSFAEHACCYMRTWYVVAGAAFSKALKSFKAHVLSQSHHGLRRTVNSIVCGEG